MLKLRWFDLLYNMPNSRQHVHPTPTLLSFVALCGQCELGMMEPELRALTLQVNDMSGTAAVDSDDYDDIWSCPQAAKESCRRRTRRVVRSAVRDCDLLTLRRVLSDVDLVNAALSDTLSSSALAYAARCGHLEVVEVLVDLPGCHIDRVDRAKRSALDEAISGWAAADGRQQQHDCARRYRIVRRLLAAGTRSLSRQVLDVVLSSALDSGTGQHFVRKLVQVRHKLNFHFDDVFAVLYYRRIAQPQSY